MTSSDRPRNDKMYGKDTISVKSTSTITSTKALLKSILAPKRYTKTLATEKKVTPTPAQDSIRKAIRAEATYHALR
jgi:hypothetical protein